uniref:Uncharacterized protein n=1 Tax=Rousettus aegyptiacus TaxID=9407 RepID=A0A7J8DIL7_ROUAE|nr:hypothetical protein HJG63_008691 [Rousettus aegyptiacus]
MYFSWIIHFIISILKKECYCGKNYKLQSQTVKVHRNCVLGASSGKVSWPLCFLDSPLTEWLQHLAWLWSGLNDLIYTKRSEEFLTHREHSMCHAPCVIFYFLSTDIIYNHGLVSQESFDDMALA